MRVNLSLSLCSQPHPTLLMIAAGVGFKGLPPVSSCEAAPSCFFGWFGHKAPIYWSWSIYFILSAQFILWINGKTKCIKEREYQLILPVIYSGFAKSWFFFYFILAIFIKRVTQVKEESSKVHQSFFIAEEKMKMTKPKAKSFPSIKLLLETHSNAHDIRFPDNNTTFINYSTYIFNSRISLLGMVVWLFWIIYSPIYGCQWYYHI